MKQGDSWDITQHPPMPRPKNDDGYFEQMSRAVFLAGLNWSVVEKKWPDIKRSLANFSIDTVAQFDDRDIDRLLKDEGMIRSAKKITAVIANAQAMQKVQKEFGSFAKYLQAVKNRNAVFERFTPYWQTPSLPVGAGSYAKISLERLTKGNLRVITDRHSNFNSPPYLEGEVLDDPTGQVPGGIIRLAQPPDQSPGIHQSSL